MRTTLLDPAFSDSYQRLSLAIADTIRAKGSCCREDMANNGFSGDEIRSYWNIAYGLAHVELMDSRNDVVLH